LQSTALPALPQVVAPVRETAAQALAAACLPLPLPVVESVLSILQDLMQQSTWTVRQGGFLGVKYVLAARSDGAQRLLPLALPALLRGLGDGDDDVRAAAAESLVPVTGALASLGRQVRFMLYHISYNLLKKREGRWGGGTERRVKKGMRATLIIRVSRWGGVG
jgi:HEAT repeat protein